MTGAVPPPEMRPKSWQQFLELCREVIDFPRHLSIHNGGMLVTGEPLVDIVPVEPATMEGRRVIQFNKDDVEDLGLIKMDMLGLRTLSVIAEALELIKDREGVRPDLDQLALNDPKVFEMCSAADTIGVFQIESRAQMQTLPRTRPNSFNDLVVEVAIIRPGPIQGNAVHPYINRKQGREPVTYPHPLLERVLKDTLGVILYQEQIIEIAMTVGGMTPSGADGFRRAMTRHLNHVEMSSLEGGFIEGCLANGVTREVADQLFAAVQGFAVYGFCRSHAAAFARTAYETAWLKLNHPVEFGCGLLNNQPMGFYHPSVLVEDLKRHGVKVLPVDVNRSDVRCLPEPIETPSPAPIAGPTLLPAGSHPQPADHGQLWRFRNRGTLPVKAEYAMRVGFNYVRDLGEDGRKAIVAERERGAYKSFDDFIDRLRGGPIGPRAVRNLVMVGAFDALGQPRRELLWGWQERWHGRGLRRGIQSQSELRLNGTAPELPALDDFDVNQLEYRISDLSTGHHLIHFCRDRLTDLGAIESNHAPRHPERPNRASRGPRDHPPGALDGEEDPLLHAGGRVRAGERDDQAGRLRPLPPGGQPQTNPRHRRRDAKTGRRLVGLGHPHPGPRRGPKASSALSRLSLSPIIQVVTRQHWERESSNWAAWARRPDFDAYWKYSPTFFELVPSPGDRTLEVGCGEGRVSRDLAARGHHVTGVDGSPTLVRLASEADSRSSYLVADAAALPFAAETFDLVVLYNSLMDVG